jgi:Tfp pilus assembly protein PilN
MILINLLPEELRPIKRTPLPHLLSIAILVAAIVGSGLMFFQTFSKTVSLKRDIAQTEQELDSLSAIVDEYNQLGERKLELQDKVSTIEEILLDRKIWSRHLHRLAQLTPENFWYSGIKETSQTFRENVIKRDPKTGQPVMDKKGEPEMEIATVQKPVLEISGYIINDEEGRANLNELLQATTEDPEFNANFELFRPSIEDTEFNGFNVRGFTAEFEILSGAPLE